VGEGDEPVDGLGFEDFDKTEKKIMEREKNMQEKSTNCSNDYQEVL